MNLIKTMIISRISSRRPPAAGGQSESFVCTVCRKSHPFPAKAPSGLPSVVASVHNICRQNSSVQPVGSVRIGGLRIPSLIFADDVIIFASSTVAFSLHWDDLQPSGMQLELDIVYKLKRRTER